MGFPGQADALVGLSPDDALILRASLVRMGLIEPEEQPALTMLTGGISSLIVRVDTRSGPICVKRALPHLKVAAIWHAPVERNAAEVKWMRLAAATVPGSVPQIRGHDEQTNAFAMEYLDPSTHPIWKAQLRDGIADPETAREVAARPGGRNKPTAGRAEKAAAVGHDAREE
jgi:hypothetical protein